MNGIQLGQTSAYPDQYDPSLLEPIPRRLSRDLLAASVAFSGWDYWHAYELSWLAPSGAPRVAIAEFAISAASENIIESKSFKYYLNSLNQSVFASIHELRECLIKDLAAVANGEVQVKISELDANEPQIESIPGRCIDKLDCEIRSYQPDASLLSADAAQEVQCEQLYSHLLKSNCPVTGQPDWATIWIEYSGNKIDEVSLLKYLVGFRQYQGFHESCVERIYSDILACTAASELSVYARYTRRGGLDINPYRVSNVRERDALPFGRTVRQ